MALDVKTAFLFGDLDEEIYLKQPEGFIKKGMENKVCCLRKAIYGLKQATLQWNKVLETDIVMSSLLFMLITYYSIVTDINEHD